MAEILRRRLGTADAVVLGLGAMLGAGVFTVFGPAAAAAGAWLPAALALAAMVAACNAFSSADLAAAHPESGGSYTYAGYCIGPWSARLAGTAFLAGKTASAAAAAGTFGVYLVPGQPVLAAVALVAAVTAVNVAGVRWTARATWVLVTVVLAVLVGVSAAGLLGPSAALDASIGTAGPGTAGGLSGLPTAAGLLFFAFAGYARIATLGEEVRDPDRTLRRAIPLALLVALTVYLLVGLAALRGLGVDRLAAEAAPLVMLAETGPGWLPAVVRVGAAVATASVLLSVLVGVSRMTLAMARRGDLPAGLVAISAQGTPWRADLTGGAVAAVLAVLAGPAAAVTLSACCVLVYYAVTNAAAMRLRRAERRWPAWTAPLGLALCLLLAVVLPARQVLVTVVVLAVGVAGTALVHRRGR